MQPRFRFVLSFTAITALSFSFAACLQPSSGATTGGVGSDVAADVGADATTDGGKEVVVVDIVEPWCFGVLCDDGNECTTDSCDDTNGQCTHTPVANGASCDQCGYCDAGQCLASISLPTEPPECSVDTDCDDGDPCTTSVCYCEIAESPCGGGGENEWCWCEHKATPNAPGCVATNACNGVGALTVEEAFAAEPGAVVKVAGSAVMGQYAVCDDSICGTCYGELAVAGDGTTLTLDGGVQDALLPAWGCTTTQCSEDKTCYPMVADVGYWVWGTLEDYDPFGSGNALESRKLVVDGWCLQSPAPSFAGVYTGRFLSQSSGIHETTLTLSQGGDGTWQVAVGEFADYQAQDGYNVVVTEGGLTFEAFVPDGWTGWSRIELQVDGNLLIGPYSPWALPLDSEAPPPDVPAAGGEARFERQNP